MGAYADGLPARLRRSAFRHTKLPNPLCLQALACCIVDIITRYKRTNVPFLPAQVYPGTIAPQSILRH